MREKTCKTCINYTAGDGLCRKLGIAKSNLVCDFYGKNLRNARNLLTLLKELSKEDKETRNGRREE